MTRDPYDPHRQADGVSRADTGLRRFDPPTVIGGATMCRRCHGGGYELTDEEWVGCYRVKAAEPRRCGWCNGEGLDPHEHGGRP